MGFGGQNPGITVNYGGYSWGTGGGTSGPAPIPVASPAPVMATSAVALILQKIYQTTGRRFTLKSVMSTIRRMSRWMQPVVIAASLGIVAEELSTLIAESSLKKRRRMNSLNPRALDRAMRRVCSFNNRVTKAKSMMSGTARYRKKRRCS